MTNIFDIGNSQQVNPVTVGDGRLTIIAGPCAIESRSHALKMAEALVKICAKHKVQLVYKSCFDKDCRSSSDSFHGVGMDEGLEILAEVKRTYRVPVTSDVSNAQWIPATAEVVDLLQIPAYLCRQTHLLVAAGKTGLPINIKKGQFMGPWNMANSVQKIVKRTGNNKIILAERGTFFGYNMLINDFRALSEMRETGCPVCYDATHSVQLPTNLGTKSGGQREFVLPLVRAACSIGIDVLFMEVHEDPPRALSDASTQYPLDQFEAVLEQALVCHELAQKFKDIKYHEIQNAR